MQKKSTLLLSVFTLFFVFLACCEALLLKIAITSYSGTVTDPHVRERMQYNSEIIQKRQKQAALGWKDEIIISQNQNIIKIIFHLTDSNDVRVDCKKLQASVIRPVTDKYDMLIDLSNSDFGYEGSLELPLHGQWDINIVGKCQNDNEFFSTRRIVADF